MTGREDVSSPSDAWVGRIVGGRYRICRGIGQGAMGVVYEAEHLLIRRKVALKMLATYASMSPASVQRFHREALAAAAVDNPHIVEVLDMGQDDGVPYIVLEHLDGMDLGMAVALAGRFSVSRAVHVLTHLCDALSAVHTAGIVHRDLKPDNLFLIEREGQKDFVKVLDFGICKFHVGVPRLTASGDTIGTPQYMAPEQVEGRTDLDQRTDIFALGGILFHMLTGQPPFDAANLPKLFLKICHEPTPSILLTDPTLPRALDAVVKRAMAKDPRLRFSSCMELKAALQSIADEDSTRCDSTTLRDPTLTRPPNPRKYRALMMSAYTVGALFTTASAPGPPKSPNAGPVAISPSAAPPTVNQAADPRDSSPHPRDDDAARSVSPSPSSSVGAPRIAAPTRPAPPPRRASTASTTKEGISGAPATTDRDEPAPDAAAEGLDVPASTPPASSNLGGTGNSSDRIEPGSGESSPAPLNRPLKDGP